MCEKHYSFWYVSKRVLSFKLLSVNKSSAYPFSLNLHVSLLHETKNMKCSLCFLLILLLSLLFPYSSLTMRTITNFRLVMEESKDHQDMSGAGSDHVQRKALHEVHSGPNPISNSTPQKKWKSNIQRNP